MTNCFSFALALGLATFAWGNAYARAPSYVQVAMNEHDAAVVPSPRPLLRVRSSDNARYPRAIYGTLPVIHSPAYFPLPSGYGNQRIQLRQRLQGNGFNAR